MSSFYADQNFLNVGYALDISITQHFANMLFKEDQTRVIYASNAFAFRKRAKENSGNLKLPFVNFKLRNYEPGVRIRWNVRAYSLGIFVPQLDAKVIFAPIKLSYEASYWCNRDDELHYAISELVFDADNKTILQPSIMVGNHELALPALKDHTGLEFEPTYNEMDWLERNKIHSASLDFEYDTFAIKTNLNICIPTRMIFNFASNNGYESNSEEDVMEFIVNHFTEEVIRDTS